MMPDGSFEICAALEGFHSRDRYTKLTYLQGGSLQENNDSDSKRLFV